MVGSSGEADAVIRAQEYGVEIYYHYVSTRSGGKRILGTMSNDPDIVMRSANAGVDLGSLLDLYDRSEETRKAVSHNIGILKCIRGGLRMAERRRIAFDPRREYWRLPERRLAVAYFADRWTGRFAPAAALRTVAQRVLLHFDQARTDAVVSYRGVDYDQGGGFDKICAALADHALRLAPIPEWEQMRAVWPKLAETAGEDVSRFLLAASTIDDWERGFKRRLPWFGYPPLSKLWNMGCVICCASRKSAAPAGYFHSA